MKRNPLAWAIAGVAAIAAIALLVVAVIGEGERYGGHGEEEHAPQAAPQREVTNGGYKLSITLTPDAGKVGEVVTIVGRVADASGNMVRNVRFELTSHHLEDDVEVFKTTFVAPDGVFNWGNQFWDGTEHEIRITASPGPEASAQFAPLTLRRIVEVEAVPPSVGVQVRAMLWLLLPVALGLAAGIPLGLRAPRRATTFERTPAAAHA
ncbi:MAG: hypothetical protein HY332_17460 [Chloroflexi bacterium]|nr:hypothetical protein [Chloroflexota bacterium]